MQRAVDELRREKTVLSFATGVLQMTSSLCANSRDPLPLARRVRQIESRAEAKAAQRAGARTGWLTRLSSDGLSTPRHRSQKLTIRPSSSSNPVAHRDQVSCWAALEKFTPRSLVTPEKERQKRIDKFQETKWTNRDGWLK